MSKENIVLKLRLEADELSANLVDGQSRICNWLYNHLLEKGQQLKQEFVQSSNKEAAKTLYTKRGLRNLLSKLIKNPKKAFGAVSKSAGLNSVPGKKAGFLFFTMNLEKDLRPKTKL